MLTNCLRQNAKRLQRMPLCKTNKQPSKPLKTASKLHLKPLLRIKRNPLLLVNKQLPIKIRQLRPPRSRLSQHVNRKPKKQLHRTSKQLQKLLRNVRKQHLKPLRRTWRHPLPLVSKLVQIRIRQCQMQTNCLRQNAKRMQRMPLCQTSRQPSKPLRTASKLHLKPLQRTKLHPLPLANRLVQIKFRQ